MFDFTIDNDQVIVALGIESSSPEFKERILERVHETLYQRVSLRVQQAMSEDEAVEFAKVAEKSDQEGKAWLEQRFPDWEAAFQEELADLIQELRETMDTAAGA